MRATTLARVELRRSPCSPLPRFLEGAPVGLLWPSSRATLLPSEARRLSLQTPGCLDPPAPAFYLASHQSYLEGGNAFGLVTTDLAHIMAVLFIVVFVLNGGVSMSHAWHMIGPRLFGNRSKDNRLQKFALVVRDFSSDKIRGVLQWLISGQFVVALSYASKQTRKGPLGATRSHCATAIRTSAIHQPLATVPHPHHGQAGGGRAPRQSVP